MMHVFHAGAGNVCHPSGNCPVQPLSENMLHRFRRNRGGCGFTVPFQSAGPGSGIQGATRFQ